MDVFAGLMQTPMRASSKPSSKRGGAFGMHKDSALSKIRQFVADHPGCVGIEVAAGVGVKRQLAYAALYALEKRGIVTSKIRLLSPERKWPRSPDFQKHYWIALIKHLEQHMTQHPESYSDNDQRWLDAAKAVYVECKE